MKKLALLLAFSQCVLLPYPLSAQAYEIQGMQILDRAITVAGGRAAVRQISDFRATGKFALYSGDEAVQEGQASALGSGLNQFRLTVTLGDRTRTLGWRNGSGILATEDGVVSPIGASNVSLLEGMTLPAQKILALLEKPAQSVQLIETSQFGDQQVYRVRITTSGNQEAGLRRASSLSIDVFINAQTFVIAGVEDELHPNTHSRSTFRHRVVYGDYRTVVGVQVPFLIREEIEGIRTWALQLESFEPNVNLTDSEFSLK